MSASVRPYKKSAEHSYAIGVFPTLELLAHRPEQVIRVLLSSQGEANQGVQRIKELCQARGIYADVADNAIGRLAGKGNVYAIGVFRKFQADPSPHDNHLVLVRPSDAGNLGTIIRAMLGFDVVDLAIIGPAVDLFDPRVIRASMGGIFQLRAAYWDDFAAYQSAFRHHVYPFMTDGERPLDQVRFETPFALVFGNEGAGLSPQFHALGQSVRIRQSPRVDSLNLAVSVGIALYVATRAPFDRPGDQCYNSIKALKGK